MCFNSLALKLYEKHVNHLFQTAETVATLRNGIGLNEKEYKLYISSKFCWLSYPNFETKRFKILTGCIHK
jgi:hypothetical protein